MKGTYVKAELITCCDPDFSRYVEKSEGVGCSQAFLFSLHPTPSLNEGLKTSREKSGCDRPDNP
ncbi:hypothetical protein [Dendronalium phyllosphericum]|uniref:hypothetical protein n=1 Tax=Dendronalium phyllosphericum TaxID=2840445 RepID=UPI0030DB7C41